MLKLSNAKLVLAPMLLVVGLASAGTPASAEAPLSGSRLDSVMLNPQPLPPRWRYNRLRWRMLNPQPLPPSPCRACVSFRLKHLNQRYNVR